MLNALIERGMKMAAKVDMLNKHVCFIVRGNRVISLNINKVRHRNSSFHSEEAALNSVHPKWREKGGSKWCSL
jgi:hypothetical protein